MVALPASLRESLAAASPRMLISPAAPAAPALASIQPGHVRSRQRFAYRQPSRQARLLAGDF